VTVFGLGLLGALDIYLVCFLFECIAFIGML
jgi:hypothetical protein